MGFSDETYAAAKKYTDNTVAGAGGLAGVPCQIQSITPITGGNRVTFLWIDNNGDEHTSTMNVMNGVDGEDGEDGKGIQSVSVNAENHLIITYTDGTTADAGQIEIHSAVDSVNGQTGAVTLDAEDVGALPDDTPIPSKTSDLTNDSGFITKVVNDLVNYYLKSETYSKTEVDDIVTAIKNSRFEVVATLPTTDIKTNVIYLVPKSPSQTSNVKDEYINLDGTTAGWEKIGDTEIDLSDYVTTQALNTALAAYTTTADLTTLLAGKQNTLTFDDVPTENSNNPVKSNGLYVANRNIYEVMGEMGAKNINKTVYVSRTTQVGIEWTVNEDGTVTANGTASGDTVNGGVATDGFIAPFTAQVILTGGISTLAHIYPYDQTTSSRPYTDSSKTELQTADATGNNEVPFYMEEGHVYNLGLRIKNTAILDNAVFKPMLRLASDTDSTYQPYAETNQQLTVETQALANVRAELGAHNWLNLDDSLLRGKEGADTSYTFLPTGIEIANTVSGTFRVCSWWIRNLKPNTDYILSSDVTKVSGTGRMFIRDSDSSTFLCDTQDITTSKNVSLPFNTGAYTSLYIAIYSTTQAADIGDIKYENLLLRLADDTSTEYQPYAKTNQQLTAENEALTNQANDIVNVLGAKNVLPFPYYEGSGTYNGVTITDNGDGSITLDGTCTGMSFFVFYGGRYSLAPTTFVKKNEDYIATLEVVSGSMAINSGTSKFVFRNYITNATSPFVDIFYEDNVIDTRSVKFTYEPTASYDTSLVWYEFNVGTTFNNWRIRPMIRLASITDSTYEPYAMTNQQMTPYVQAISNPNLLDNPWFTVNQRGFTTKTFSAQEHSYSVDRWRIISNSSAGNSTVTLNNGAITVSNDDNRGETYFEQLFENGTFENGRNYTLSVMLSDGTIVKGTNVMPTGNTGDTVKTFITFTGGTFYVYHPANGNYYVTMNRNNGSITIKAVKLELGSVSTLASDTVPNYQQELAKCQRYFFRKTVTGGVPIGFGFSTEATTARLAIILPVSMRATPTVVVDTAGNINIVQNGAVHAASAASVVWMQENICALNLTTTGLQGNNYPLSARDGGVAHIDLSADL